MSRQGAMRYVVYSLFGSLLTVAGIFLVKAPTVIHRIINGFFIGGIVILSIGLCKLVYQMGIFDLFLYSHKRMKQVLKQETDEVLAEKQLTGYHDYLLDKRRNKEYIEPLLVGVLFLLPSVLLALLFT